jgi:hypothetical protein
VIVVFTARFDTVLIGSGEPVFNCETFHIQVLVNHETTLMQELVAPKKVDFYSKERSWLGDKRSLEPLIREITGIPANALRGTPLSDFTVAEREAWVRGRQTTHEEDMAYSLLGIFDVYLLPIYGEGRDNAQRRLREEVQKKIKGKYLIIK